MTGSRRTRWTTCRCSPLFRPTPRPASSPARTPGRVGPTTRANESPCRSRSRNRGSISSKSRTDHPRRRRPSTNRAACRATRPWPPDVPTPRRRTWGEATGRSDRAGVVGRELVTGCDVGNDEQRPAERQRADLRRRRPVPHGTDRRLGLANRLDESGELVWLQRERTVRATVGTRIVMCFSSAAAPRATAAIELDGLSVWSDSPTGHDHLVRMSAIVARSICAGSAG